MATDSANNDEIEELERRIRATIRLLALALQRGIDFEDYRVQVRVRQLQADLGRLDRFVEAWGQTTVGRVYRARRDEVRRELRDRGLTVRMSRRRRASANRLHRDALEALIRDPVHGIVPRLQQGIEQVRTRLFRIVHQGRVLRRQWRMIGDTVDRLGYFQGASANDVRDHLVREILRNDRTAQDMVWTQRARQLPIDDIVREVADLPYVKFPSRASNSGFVHLRLDDYVATVARTRTRQAATVATRNELLLNGHELVQISISAPLQDDACWLYVGKVFALTPDGKARWNVPTVSELPNGGAPFHPNCTHAEIAYLPQFRTEEELALVMVPPPRWALNRPFAEVQKEWKKRGGVSQLAQLNAAGQTYGVKRGGRQRLDRERARGRTSGGRRRNRFQREQAS